MANEKLRYSDQELEEFRAIIDEKLKVAKQTYHDCMAQLNHSDSNDVVDTSPTYKALEEGSEAQSKEEIIQMAQRQQKFIKGLEAALVRIQNKTYGIDRETGELIPKERLRAVPHATLSVASKEARKSNKWRKQVKLKSDGSSRQWWLCFLLSIRLSRCTSRPIFALASLFVLLIGFISNLLRTTEWLGVCRLSASSG
mgnify:CR=1 FL=1